MDISCFPARRLIFKQIRPLGVFPVVYRPVMFDSRRRYAAWGSGIKALEDGGRKLQ